jgi:hypothetical protein
MFCEAPICDLPFSSFVFITTVTVEVFNFDLDIQQLSSFVFDISQYNNFTLDINNSNNFIVFK